MTDQEIEPPLAKHLLLTLDKFQFLRFVKDKVKGKGSREFLKTLPAFHYHNGKSTPYGKSVIIRDRFGVPVEKTRKVRRYAKCISDVALEVWKDPDARDKWLCYHRAVSALVPNLK